MYCASHVGFVFPSSAQRPYIISMDSLLLEKLSVPVALPRASCDSKETVSRRVLHDMAWHGMAWHVQMCVCV